LFGWKEEDVVGLPIHHLKLTPGHFEEECHNRSIPLQKENHFLFHRTTWKRKDGRLLHVDTSYSSIKNKNGEIMGFMWIFKKVSEQTEKERQFKESQQYHQSAAQNHPVLIFQLDSKGRILKANHSVEQVTGYSWKDLMNCSFASLITPDSLASAMEHFHAVLQGEIRHYQCSIYNQKKERLLLKLTNIPIIANNAVTGVLGIAQNMTEHKSSQNERIRAKEIPDTFPNIIESIVNLQKINQKSTDDYSENEVLWKNLSVEIPENKTSWKKSFQIELDGTLGLVDTIF
ncbi:PAS domain-containing protein, partial [Bacillus smithii]|uniref:PAS domain-containing protein n=1 Tax=Bacillus smithii TaxID=1479 RepID=UPI0030C9498F